MRRNFVLGSVGLIVVFGLLAFGLVRSALRGRIDDALEARADAELELFDRSYRLELLEFAEQVRDRAGTRGVIQLFAVRDAAERRARAHAAANGIGDWFRDPSRSGKLGRPDVVVITDETGTVVARDADPNRMHGQKLSKALPKLREVLSEGRVETDVWADEAQAMTTQQLAMAPIRDERGKILGALVVGYGITDGALAKHAEWLDRGVAVVEDGRLVATSLSKAVATDLEKALASEPIAQRLSLAHRGGRSRFELTLGGTPHLVTATHLPGSETRAVTALLLVDRARAESLLGVAGLIWPLTAALAVVAAIFGWIMANRVLLPVAKMEEGLLGIINGDVEQRIVVDDPDLGGLAYRINQLVSVFVGEGEPAKAPDQGTWKRLDEDLSRAPTEASRTASSPTDPIDDPDLSRHLAAEPEDDYLARVYAEYASAKRAVGEDMGQITEEKFRERLRASARSLAERHGCPVRFVVESSEGRIILRPALVRDLDA